MAVYKIMGIYIRKFHVDRVRILCCHIISFLCAGCAAHPRTPDKEGNVFEPEDGQLKKEKQGEHDEKVPEMLDKLYAAGLQNIIDEAQAQMDAYLASK